MICSALTRIMPADMIVHGSTFSEPNRVDSYIGDWFEYARGKDEAINSNFNSNYANYHKGVYEMGWNAERRDFATMQNWARDLTTALIDRKNGVAS